MGTTIRGATIKTTTVIDGSFTPLIIPTCVGWFDASDANSISLSGSNVTQWNDKSSSKNNLTAGISPAYITNAQNGKNVVRFASASSQYLRNTSAALFRAVSGWTIFIVCKLTGNFANYPQAVFVNGAAAGTNSVRAHIAAAPSGATGQFYGGGKRLNSDSEANAQLSSLVSASAYYCVSTIADYSAATAQIWDNLGNTNIKSPFQTAGVSSNDFGLLYVGSSSVPNLYWNGDICEIALYSSALSSNDRIVLEKYFRQKWALA